MSVKNLVLSNVGKVGVDPQTFNMDSDDSYAAITTPGFLNNISSPTVALMKQGDFVLCLYNNSGVSTSIILTVNIAGSQITLQDTAGSVVLPVVSGDFANFSGTAGAIEDAGYSPTNAAKTKVVMASAAVIANHIACFSDTAGTVNDDAATAINGGNIQAGLSGTAGTLSSFPATAAKGSLKLSATANTGDTITTITNAAMAQTTAITIPDPGAASANVLLSAAAVSQTITSGDLVISDGHLDVSDSVNIGATTVQGELVLFPGAASSGFMELKATQSTGNFATNITNANMGQATTLTIPDPGAAAANFLTSTSDRRLLSGTTATYAGGGTSNAFTATGLTASHKVVASILTSTNAVAVAKAVPTSDTLTITFTADPGAGTTLSWIATLA